MPLGLQKLKTLFSGIGQQLVALAFGRLSSIAFSVPIELEHLLCWVLTKGIKYRQKVVERNLEVSFPTKSRMELKAIERDFYQWFAQVIIEIAALPKVDEEWVRKKIDYGNKELLDSYFLAEPSFLALTGHFGNWEILLQTAGFYGGEKRVMGIYQPLSNAGFDAIIYALRSRFNSTPVPSKKVIRECLRSQKAYSISMVADQAPQRGAGITGKLCAQETMFLDGPWLLHKALRLQACYISMVPIARRRYKISIEKIADSELLPAEDFVALYAAALSHTIQEAPHAYLWSHRRFKHQVQYSCPLVAY